MDAGVTSGWTDPAGNEAPLATLPVLGAGKGFFYGNNSAKTNITFVGDVRTGTNNVALPLGLTAAGSPLPYNGLVSTGPLNLQVQDGDSIQQWTGTSWAVYTRDAGEPTGWTGPSGAGAPQPTLNVGQGFFYANNNGLINWQQVLNP